MRRAPGKDRSPTSTPFLGGNGRSTPDNPPHLRDRDRNWTGKAVPACPESASIRTRIRRSRFIAGIASAASPNAATQRRSQPHPATSVRSPVTAAGAMPLGHVRCTRPNARYRAAYRETAAPADPAPLWMQLKGRSQRWALAKRRLSIGPWPCWIGSGRCGCPLTISCTVISI